MNIKRGEIYLVNLDPVIGSEQGKTRPVLVIQNNIGNEFSPTIIIAAITSNIFKKNYLFNIFISSNDSGLNKNSTILLNQIRTIDRKRIIKKLGEIDNNTIKKIDKALIKSLGIEIII